MRALRVCLSAGVFLWDCEIPKVGTGQPSHPCSVFLPESKIGRSGEVVNKTLLQWQTHKSRYGAGGSKYQREEGLGAVVTEFSDKHCDQDSTHTHTHTHSALHIQTLKLRNWAKHCPKQDVNG